MKREGELVIDADGHWVEFSPVVSEALRRIGGDRAADGFRAVEGLINRILSFSDDERRARRSAQQAWWSFPTANTIDGATALFPRLLYERLDELGMDYAVLYPTGALGIAFNPDAEWVREHQDLYARGQVGDVAVKKRLIEVLDAFLEPIRARRRTAGRDVVEVLRAGTARANVVAEETLALAKRAMRQDLFPRRLTL